MAQIRFNYDGREAIISVSLAAAWRDQGLGAVVISRACQEYSQRLGSPIVAHIRPENVTSQKSFARAGFKKWGSDLEQEVVMRYER